MHSYNKQLLALKQQKLFRQRRLVDGPQGTRLEVDGRQLLSFCSNDYLGLAADPRLIRAMQDGAHRYGVGAGASHLVTGHQRPHVELEESLADWLGAERALLFSTGYMANLAIVSSLMDRHSTVFEDKLNHASLIDAARLSQAAVHRYPHGDVARLSAMLQETNRAAMITTDGVFSMDGDLAPLVELSRLTKGKDAWLHVDDAHGLGVLSEDGRGSLAVAGLAPTDRVLLMGTLGKAFGTFGAFVAGDRDPIEWLLQKARTYIYTTALPPAVAQASNTALSIIRSEPERRWHLQALIGRFRNEVAAIGLPLGESHTPIQPIIFGTAEKAVRASELLQDRGILVAAIRPPTVPQGTARLRVTLSAAHSEEDLARLINALGEVSEHLLKEGANEAL